MRTTCLVLTHLLDSIHRETCTCARLLRMFTSFLESIDLALMLAQVMIQDIPVPS